MKSYQVHRIRKSFSSNSTEDLRKETEELLNRKVAEGCKVITVDFEMTGYSGYIYAMIVLEK